MNKYFFSDNTLKPFDEETALKNTALKVLQEALRAEEYERCPGLVERAQKAGATLQEVRTALSEYKTEGKDKGDNKPKTTPRF